MVPYNKLLWDRYRPVENTREGPPWDGVETNSHVGRQVPLIQIATNIASVSPLSQNPSQTPAEPMRPRVRHPGESIDNGVAVLRFHNLGPKIETNRDTNDSSGGARRRRMTDEEVSTAWIEAFNAGLWG